MALDISSLLSVVHSYRDFKIAAILGGHIPRVLTEDTHTLLEPGFDKIDENAHATDATEVMSQDEWYNSWLEGC